MISKPREVQMPTYVLLADFTDQGIRAATESPKRAFDFKALARKCGANVKEFFWTLGRYDMVAIIEAPDDETVTAIGLSVGKLGNVRTETLRAYNDAEMSTIVKKMV
jgi:uncharacterized protein with GYD domain